MNDANIENQKVLPASIPALEWAGKAWCGEKTKSKIMDEDLAFEFAKIIDEVIYTEQERKKSDSWACLNCGYTGKGFYTVENRGSPTDPFDYDCACPECDSTETRESVEEVLWELVELRDKYFNKMIEAQVEINQRWNPILGAPKNGFHILLYRDDIQFVGYYGGENCGWIINAPGLPKMWPEPTHWTHLPEVMDEMKMKKTI